MQLFLNTNYNFIGIRKHMMVLSLVLILIGIVSIVIQGGLDYTVDFIGGELLWFRFEKSIQIETIRDSLKDIVTGSYEVTTTSGDREVLIKIQKQAEGQQLADTIRKALDTNFPDNHFELLNQEFVGPKIGKELKADALKAILLSMVVILLYIAYRFEFKYAVGAIVALIHDVMITIGIFSIFGMDISLEVIAAILTIVGYSLNDTIVVYDRIREELKQRRKESYLEVVNSSINKTLSRTINTSFTTLFVVTCLFFIGGEVLKGFSLALIIGIVTGTYSSVFIASPIVVEWHLKSSSKQLKKPA